MKDLRTSPGSRKRIFFARSLEYQTWAGMIVTQYGRIPGDLRTNGIGFGGNGSHGDSPPRQSAALDKLQRYYGTGDTCSEPEDFRPGPEMHSPRVRIL